MEKLENKPGVQTSTGINIMVLILSITAGWVDAIGIELFLNENTAFMTGRVKALGYHIYNLDLKLFLGVFLVIIAFVIGSFISTIVTRRTGLKGGLIFTGMLIIISSIPTSSKYISVIFLPMGMGCQNAATSLTPINRTTHLTGPLTDLGINLAKKDWQRVMFWGWRLIGFPLGSFVGFSLANMVNNTKSVSIILAIPAIIIILTGIIQERVFSIPLLENVSRGRG